MSTSFWDTPTPSYEQVVADIGTRSLWDTAYLSGTQIPGIVSVKGAPGRKISIQSGPGTDGATILDQGFEPAKVTISVLVWTPEQWLALQALLAQYVPKPGKSAQKGNAPIALSHPGANALGVTAIVIQSVTAPEPGSVVGSWTCTISAIQYVRSKKAPVRDLSDIATLAPTEGKANLGTGSGSGISTGGGGTLSPYNTNTGPTP